jgi:hypothetical protein
MINNSLGSEVGDAVRLEVASRLSDAFSDVMFAVAAMGIGRLWQQSHDAATGAAASISPD